MAQGQKEFDKYIPGFKKCLTLRGAELSIAKEQGDMSLQVKMLVHIVQHHYFAALDGYDISTEDITVDEAIKVRNHLANTCPGIQTSTLTDFVKRLPIKIGRWIVGSTDYVS